jgi:multimeric flavodoxin WrbA
VIGTLERPGGSEHGARRHHSASEPADGIGWDAGDCRCPLSIFRPSVGLTALVPLIHLGMVFVGTPYAQNPQILVTDGIGGSPYGPGTLAGTDGSRQPVEAELTTARNLGSRLARVADRLKDLRLSRASAP